MEMQKQFCGNFGFVRRAHEKISNLSAQILGPIVFNFGAKEKAWDLSTADLLQFPEGSLGKSLGEFLQKARLEPLARAEAHDAYHVLFGYSTRIRDEVGLQFFLRGNGKTSIASFGVSIGAWCIFPHQWNYFRSSYQRGKECCDISKFNLRDLLDKDLTEIRRSLFEKS
jgi:ubiquinone biosynthesis protein Coq4